MFNLSLRNQQLQNMKEQKDYQSKSQEEQANFIMKSFRFLTNISPLKLFQKNPEEVQLSREEEQQWKKRIIQTWSVIDKMENFSESSEVEEQDNNDIKGYQKQEEELSEQDSDEDDPQLMKVKMQKLLEAYKQSEKEKKKLKQENAIMRRQLQEWLKSPIKIRKYARIQGQLCFDKECDQVKVEKSSILYIQEDNN